MLTIMEVLPQEHVEALFRSTVAELATRVLTLTGKMTWLFAQWLFMLLQSEVHFDAPCGGCDVATGPD